MSNRSDRCEHQARYDHRTGDRHADGGVDHHAGAEHDPGDMIQLLCENRIGVVGIDAQLTREVPADLVITQSVECYIACFGGGLSNA